MDRRAEKNKIDANEENLHAVTEYIYSVTAFFGIEFCDKAYDLRQNESKIEKEN